MNNHTLRWATACAALTLCSASWAHGDGHGHAHHAKKPAGAHHHATDTDFGRPGDPKKVTRTIQVDMRDTMRFSPDNLTVRRGDTVRLKVANKGQVMHELVLGTPEDIQKHWEAMKKHPDMAHDDPSMVHVAPGRTGEIIWQFTRAGEFHFACLLPGHFEAGMRGKVLVK